MTNAERFERICKTDSESVHIQNGIGTLSEKRLHRILKCYLCADSASHEVKLGRYVADVFNGNEISTPAIMAFRTKG